MNRNHLLFAGTAALFAMGGCQPTTQDGTGATPSGMPADTAITDTTIGDTLTAVSRTESRWSIAHAAGEGERGK